MTLQSELLKHSIKAIEYRFIKATTGSKDNFGNFKISEHTRSPNEIINHMFDLVSKTMSMINEGHFNCPSPVRLEFEAEIKRFLSGLQELASEIGDKEINLEMSKRLLQGPILDIATHIGQIAMLNGINGNKIPKENYYSQNI